MKILKYPNKALTTPTKEWDFEDNTRVDLVTLALQVQQVLLDTPNGLALAANQVGLPHRFFVIRDELADKYNIPTVIVNPKLLDFGQNKEETEEGCLSFPGIFVKIKRPGMVKCSFQNTSGDPKHVFLEDLGARVFQHECEHLDGRLFTDNVDRIQRFQILGRMRKAR